MNVLGFVFWLLLLIAYSFAAAWNQQLGFSRVRSSYLGNHKATQHLISQAESAVYIRIPYKKQPKSSNKQQQTKTTTNKKNNTLPPNSPCTRLNLWPLVQEGCSADPCLYAITCKLIETFYGPLLTSSSKQFLDTLLKSAKTALRDPDPLPLEKIFLPNEAIREIYYSMLKGTKDWDQSGGYPPLTDYVKIDPDWTEKLCLSHAHPNLLQILFGPKAGQKLYLTLHEKNPPPLTPALIDQIFADTHQTAPNAVGLYSLILFGRSNHKLPSKRALSAQDQASNVSVKTQVFLPSS